MRVGVFQSRGRVESDSLGSRLAFVPGIHGLELFNLGVGWSVGSVLGGLAFCLKNMRVGVLQSQKSG